jgi:hypothetical protein
MDYKAELVSQTSSRLIHFLLKENRELKAEILKLKDELALYRRESNQIYIEPEDINVTI